MKTNGHKHREGLVFLQLLGSSTAKRPAEVSIPQRQATYLLSGEIWHSGSRSEILVPVFLVTEDDIWVRFTEPRLWRQALVYPRRNPRVESAVREQYVGKPKYTPDILAKLLQTFPSNLD